MKLRFLPVGLWLCLQWGVWCDTRPEGAPESSGYVLGPDDQLAISGLEIDEIAGKPLQVGLDGVVTLPMIGPVKAGGLTVREFEAALKTKLAEVIRHPVVSVTVTEFRSQPISVLGAVNNAGVHQLRGMKTLTEALSLAGGVRPDAGYRIKIVRQAEWGMLPLPGAHPDESGRFSVGEVNLKDVLEAKNPDENIRIMPHDVITVPRAEMVYVMGEVPKQGGFVLNENESMSVLQAVSLAGGLKVSAAPKKARILRPNPDGKERSEIHFDLKRLLSAQGKDIQLQADDILFIPLDGPKVVSMRVVETAVSIGTGVIIWRH